MTHHPLTATTAAQLRAAGGIVTASSPLAAVTVPSRVTAADAGARKLTGRILTYGETGNTSAGRLRFAAGALSHDTDLSGVKLLVEHDAERVIGYAESITASGNDLLATFHVAPGELGDQVLQSAAAKLRDGLSVGVQVIEGHQAADGVYEVTAGAIREVSSVAVPAFSAGRVSTVAASAQLPGAGQPQPQPPIVGQPGSALPAGPTALPYTPPGAGQPPAGTVTAAGTAPARGSARTTPRLDAALVAATEAYRAGGPASLVTAALTDVTGPTDTAGNQAVRDTLISPQVLGELWTASLVERPFIDAFGGPKPLTSWKGKGYRVDRAASYGVAEYAGRKADVPSPNNLVITPAEMTSRRIAAAHDFDRIFLDLGDSVVLRQYLDIQTDHYRILTEDRFATDVVAGATDAGSVPTVARAVARAARGFRRIGARPSIVMVGDDLFDAMAELPKDQAPWLFTGALDLATGRGDLSGITFAAAAQLAGDQVLVADPRAATFYEHGDTPIKVEAVNIPQGGIDLGVFGYMADLVSEPAALQLFTVAEPVAETP